MEITFEKGIPGFEEYKSFIIDEIKENPKFKTITSTTDSNVGFILISPFDVDKDYEIDLNQQLIDDLEISTAKDVLILNIVTLGKTLQSSTVNLKAPVIINIENNKGKQLILQDDKYKIKEPLN